MEQALRTKENFLNAAPGFKMDFENYHCFFFTIKRVGVSNIYFIYPIHFFPDVAIFDIDEFEELDIQPPHPDFFEANESTMKV